MNNGTWQADDSQQDSGSGLAEVDDFLRANEAELGLAAREKHGRSPSLDAHKALGSKDPPAAGYSSPPPLRSTAGTANADSQALAVALYLVAACMSDTYVNHLSVRAPASLLLCLPTEALVVVIAVAAVRVIEKYRDGSNALSSLLGLRTTLLPSYLWKAIAPLALLVFASNTLRVPAAYWLDSPIKAALLTYASPTLIVLASVFGTISADHTTTSTALLLCVSLIPAAFGVAIVDIPAIPSGVLVALLYVTAEAGKTFSAHHWFQTQCATPFSTLAYYAPINALLALPILLPVAGFSGVFKLLNRWTPLYITFYIILSVFFQLATLQVTRSLASPLALASLLSVRATFYLVLGGASWNLELWTLAMSSLGIVAALTPRVGQLVTRFSHSYVRLGENDIDAEDPQPSSLTSKSTILQRAPYFSFLPLLLWLCVTMYRPSAHSSLPWRHGAVSPAGSHSLDVVIAYYNEPMEGFHQLKSEIATRLAWRNVRINWVLYLKDEKADAAALKDATGVDRIIRLPNLGREGGTYLKHILLNYNATLEPSLRTADFPGLADKTLFVQPHLAWDWIARKRLDIYRDDTGYLALGPYITMSCAHDDAGNGDFDRYPHVYALFRNKFCPPTHQLAAYAAQFFASKKRILANTYDKYQGFDEMYEPPDEHHWIYEEGRWWKYHGEPGPSNPYLGHMLERFWPVMFGCEDPNIAQACQGDFEGDPDKCQCFD